MRRLTPVLLAVPLVATVALAGCSSGKSAGSSGTVNQSVSVSGTTGAVPKVHIPAKPASKDLVTKTLIPGHGAKLTTEDSYLANFEVYVWDGKTNKEIISSYTATPEALPVTMGLTGLQKALAGQRVGARVLAVLPPKFAYGTQGNSQIGVTASDTMVWVIDLLQAYPPNASATGKQITSGGGSLPVVSAPPGNAPEIKIPKTAPPSKLVVKTLIQGTGPAVKSGQTIVVRYVGSIWRTGKVFNNNWPSTTAPTTPPNVFTLGKLIPAWNTGLVGAPVGSRVMLVVPPAEGYGPKGNSQAGITGTDTLVFVVDILATA